MLASVADGAVVRDIQAIPYRKTSAYKRNLAQANAQKAGMRHRRQQLWDTEAGQSTSGMLRRPGGLR
jgi:hypothetical protein